MLSRRAHHLASHSIPTSCGWQLQWRSKSSHARIAKGDDLGPTRSGDYQTFRARRDGGGKELPLPPLLDPLVIERRALWEAPKAQPKAADFTPFQKKIQANPYAHALSSPVRQCRANIILLPVALLTSLHVRPHPTTGDPWLLPVSLTTVQKYLGPPYHFVESQFLAKQLGKKKQWLRGVYARFEEKFGGNVLKKLVWREDLAQVILDLKQKQLVKKLSWSTGIKGRLTPVASPRPEDIHQVDDVSCILIFRSLRTQANECNDRAKDLAAQMDKWASYVAKNYMDKLDPHAAPHVTHKSPSWYSEPVVPRLQPRAQFPELDFNTTIWRGRKVAVYSLTDLLGEDKARGLIQGSVYAEENCVAVKCARHNVPMEVLLMRLQAYLARPGP
ncbi:hypothetical protein BDU57DRAFT_437365 [Ampelomyces quisqualis]|uniref:Uncharacterized protein n=1 Tax=Ampelomyces quisqualis TaxID=50730 RepID=A0A6A5R0I1_AMPQU|nr:hypothetical protein BDU57DRAFT_437365 [Ampelomyces quisqualis]